MTINNGNIETALTNAEFWNEYLDLIKLPNRLDINKYGDKCFDSLFHKIFKPGQKSFLEIGCAPGKFMIYFAEQFGYRVSGIDFSQTGYEMTSENLKLAGVKGDVIKGDFLSASLPKENWDIVFSSGFIEHFSDPITILQKKLSLLKRGGILLTTIPNFTGFSGLIRKIMNKEIYLKHNLIIGHDLLNIYKSLELKDISIGYFGSLRIDLSPLFGKKIFGKKTIWYMIRAFDKVLVTGYKISNKSIEGRWVSSNIYCYGVKPK